MGQSEEKLKKDDDESVQKIPTKNNLRPNDPKVQLSLKYSLRTMTLTVVVHRARNLQETPHSLLPNPYVKFYLLESIGVSHNIRRANSKRKTNIKKNSVNPLFEETLIYYLMPDEMRSSRLEVILGSDHGILGRNEVLGRNIVNLQAVYNRLFDGNKDREVTVTEWFSLVPPVTPNLADSNGSMVSRSSSNASSLSAVMRKKKRPQVTNGVRRSESCRGNIYNS